MLGCDLIEIDRIKASVENMESTLLKGFSPVVKSTSIINEMVMLAFFAGRFAAKESISKSLKTGIGKFSFTDIEITK